MSSIHITLLLGKNKVCQGRRSKNFSLQIPILKNCFNIFLFKFMLLLICTLSLQTIDRNQNLTVSKLKFSQIQKSNLRFRFNKYFSKSFAYWDLFGELGRRIGVVKALQNWIIRGVMAHHGENRWLERGRKYVGRICFC